MRQAGRYLPGYKAIRAKYSVLEIAKTPSACEEVTLMPVRELGVDAAVMFADIMLPLEGMGVSFGIEENVGPIISNPISQFSDAERLREFDPKRDVPYVVEAMERVRTKLDETANALVGFSGAPFTIASYLIEGHPSRDFQRTKRLMFNDRDTWNHLMSKLSRMVASYLSAQISSGADAVQLFDSWVGALSSDDYNEFVAPYVKAIFEQIASDHPDTPKIHFATGSQHLLSSMKEKAGGDVFSIDWRVPISSAREILGGGVGIQGNLEPAVLLSKDKEGFISARTKKVIEDNGERPGHIFNLGHGILRDTPPENARFVVDYVHNNS